MSTTEAKKHRLSFSTFPFAPHPWERKLIHNYSVRPPLWWRSWLKLRTLGAKVGIR